MWAIASIQASSTHAFELNQASTVLCLRKEKERQNGKQERERKKTERKQKRMNEDKERQ